MEEAGGTTNQQSSSSKTAQVEALSALLEGAGLEPADLLTALTALAESRRQQQYHQTRQEHLPGQRTGIRRRVCLYLQKRRYHK